MHHAFSSTSIANYIKRYCIPNVLYTTPQIATKPYIIGVTGINSALGKTTIGEEICKNADSNKFIFIDLDDWITISRNERSVKNQSGADPLVYAVEELKEFLNNIILRKTSLSKPVYDHVTGNAYSATEEVNPADVICLSGGACLWPSVRQYINYIVCIKPESDKTGLEMTIERNIKERQYNIDEAYNEYSITKTAYENYVIPFVHFADIHIRVDRQYNYFVQP